MRFLSSLAFICLFFSVALGGQKVVCIDPGHPSEIGNGTKGKVLTELEAAWKVGLDLKKRLESAGYKVVMTKSKRDQFVKNIDRAKIANKAKADLMIRLHCDHAPNHSGFATFFADRSGKHEGVTGPSTSVLKRVKSMAPDFHKAAMDVLDGHLKDRGLRTDRQTNVGSRFGALIGSIHSEVPSILVEMAVLNNAKDEAFLRSKKGHGLMIEALFKGVESALRS